MNESSIVCIHAVIFIKLMGGGVCVLRLDALPAAIRPLLRPRSRHHWLVNHRLGRFIDRTYPAFFSVVIIHSTAIGGSAN